MTNTLFLKRITEMAKIDQDLRFAAQEQFDQTGKLSAYNYLIYVTDFVHGERLKRLIKQYGYPTRKMLSADGLAAFWLLVQHQDYDTDLQKKCLKNCEFTAEHKKLLVDRIRVNEGRPQKYGTQRTK